MDHIGKITKRKMEFIAILISMICILGWLGITTIIASATVTPRTPFDETGMHKVGVTKVRDILLVSCKERLQKSCEHFSSGMGDFTSTAGSEAFAVARTDAISKMPRTDEASASITRKSSTKTGTKTENEVTGTSVKTAEENNNNQAVISDTLRSSVDTSLINAFEELGFEINIEPSGDCVGCFSASKHTLTMRSTCVSTFRHEMGHFLDALKNMASKSSEFASIYKKEKSNYAGANVEYITKNAQEYFAQSYRNYLENKSKLKADHPLTYTFIQKQIAGISKEDITQMYNKYSWSW